MLGMSGVKLTLVLSPFRGDASKPASGSPVGPCGYQCTTTKSTAPQAIGRTVSFQGCGEASLVCQSGQLPGAVSTAPTRIEGSTAFPAALNLTSPMPYVDG